MQPLTPADQKRVSFPSLTQAGRGAKTSTRHSNNLALHTVPNPSTVNIRKTYADVPYKSVLAHLACLTAEMAGQEIIQALEIFVRHKAHPGRVFTTVDFPKLHIDACRLVSSIQVARVMRIDDSIGRAGTQVNRLMVGGKARSRRDRRGRAQVIVGENLSTRSGCHRR